MTEIGLMIGAPHQYSSWEDYERDLALLAGLGFNGIEMGIRDPRELDVARLDKSLAVYGLKLLSWTTGSSYFEDHLCLTVPDAVVRARAVDRLKAHADLSAHFGAVVVVGQMQGFKSDEPDRDRANERTVECLRQVAAYAESAGGRFALEPVNRFEVGHNYTAAEVLPLVDRIASPAFDIMLDTFHINIEESSLTAPFRLTAGRLRHLHVMDNQRALLGAGHLDLALMLRTSLETGYQGPWVFGSFGPESLAVRAGAVTGYLARTGLMSLLSRQ
jgi:5-keto-L-gluconate epimerase